MRANDVKTTCMYFVVVSVWRVGSICSKYTMIAALFSVSYLFHTSDIGRETTLNATYGLCGSYPSVLIVPASVTDDEVKAVSHFRSEQRVPVLCWGRQADSASIWRSSQPKVTTIRMFFDATCAHVVSGSITSGHIFGSCGRTLLTWVSFLCAACPSRSCSNLRAFNVQLDCRQRLRYIPVNLMLIDDGDHV